MWKIHSFRSFFFIYLNSLSRITMIHLKMWLIWFLCTAHWFNDLVWEVKSAPFFFFFLFFVNNWKFHLLVTNTGNIASLLWYFMVVLYHFWSVKTPGFIHCNCIEMRASTLFKLSAFMFHKTKKVWNVMRLRKWWHNVNFWVNYLIKLYADIQHQWLGIPQTYCATNI